jgi:hypothetical protein
LDVILTGSKYLPVSHSVISSSIVEKGKEEEMGKGNIPQMLQEGKRRIRMEEVSEGCRM